MPDAMKNQPKPLDDVLKLLREHHDSIHTKRFECKGNDAHPEEPVYRSLNREFVLDDFITYGYLL